ncbi:ABC transporter ATP-binding protein [Bacillus horti]|uniref:ATP-binding cassette subfamily B protein n=1 Tax=Caldalkalibacillus horti TaxID=77523 RepID=A0ABT9W0B5_9BACI|nr:ABC transporter ATP-binding protein [Bacillus horti]MDQ0166661.1 ATP-binding cassette subfamily B protein [Bacillus horti]
MLRKLWEYYRPYKALLGLDLFSSLMVALLSLSVPLFTRHLINDVIPMGDWSAILQLCLILLALYVALLLFEFSVDYFGHILGINMIYDMRKKLFRHIHTLSFDYFDRTKKGEIMSRVMHDLEEIPEVAHHVPEDFFLSIVRITGAFALLCYINVKLTLLVFSILPFMLIFMFIYNKVLGRRFKYMQENLADVNARLEDSLSGAKIVKSFTNEEQENIKFDEGNRKYRALWKFTHFHLGVFSAGVQFFSNLGMWITLAAGGYFIVQQEINIGDLVAYMMYITLLLQPLQVLIRFIEMYQKGKAGFNRFSALLTTKPTIISSPEAYDLPTVKGDIELNNVTFSYEADKEIIQNITLRIYAGETIAIVGPSGAGKSTLCQLIPRFYDLDEGEIRIDGHPITKVSLESLRKQIGMVQQDIFLFSGTIKENIAYGNLKSTDEDIIRAAQAAHAHEFIQSLSDGYNTYIGERGAKLSGGQKQRISIARMFLKNPPILILDEATSALDNKSERMIKKALEELSQGRTTIIIAHRLDTIKKADRIIVLTEEGIAEQGTHHQLLQKRGAYYQLYEDSQEVELLT